MLKVGIEVSGLTGGKQASGLQRYVSALVAHLADQLEVEDMRLYLYAVTPANSSLFQPGTPLAQALSNDLIHWRTAPFQRGWWKFTMGALMLTDGLDVFHFPAPQMADFCTIPAVVTFHDLAAISLQGNLTSKESRYLPDALDAAHRAKTLIAVSESARREVMTHLNRTDVHTIPEGVDLRQFKPANESTVSAMRQVFGLDRYILCVGTLQTRKNHLGLIQAFERILGQTDHMLVLVGGDGSGAETVHGYLKDHPNPRIKLLGYVDENLLPALYTGADVLALPSYWEGFGLPLVEAMACGTPVLTSNTSSLIEVVGDDAVIVDPHNIDDIAAKLLMLLTDSALRQRLIERGFARARLMSWERNAQETIRLYRQTATKR